jgi:putative hydrolases of HD superfamily
MIDDQRLKRILDFLLLTDRFKTIERKGYIADGSRRENDAEHTWHMGCSRFSCTRNWVSMSTWGGC